MDAIIRIGFPIVGLVCAGLLLLAFSHDRSGVESRPRLLWCLAACGMAYWSVARLIHGFMTLSRFAHAALDRSATMVGGVAGGMLLCLVILRAHKRRE